MNDLLMCIGRPFLSTLQVYCAMCMHCFCQLMFAILLKWDVKTRRPGFLKLWVTTRKWVQDLSHVIRENAVCRNIRLIAVIDGFSVDTCPQIKVVIA